MFYLEYGDIIPGKGIGKLRLGMSRAQVEETIKEYTVDARCATDVLMCGDVQIWVHKEKDAVTQILVEGSFKGKFAGIIGIGSTLSDVQNLLHLEWYDDLDATHLKGVPGICFELVDTDDEYDWDELTAPIEYISVFSEQGY